MRTIRTKIYRFAELSAQAQAKAIDQFRNTNVDFDWWDSTYEDFSSICKLLGITVDLKHTYFSGFAHQGQGASFSADIDLFALIQGINTEKWREHAPKLDTEANFTPDKCTIDRRILRLIQNDCITFSTSCTAIERPYFHTAVHTTFDYTSNECVNYNNINRALSDLEDWIEATINELSALLFKMLETEYDYLTSDEAVKESIEANEYEFTIDGKQF